MSDVKLSDYQWERIHLFLKRCPNIYVGQEKECRNFLDAVFWITRSGSQWRLLPSSYGNWNTIYKRFSRWSRSGVFEQLFEHVAGDQDLEYLLIDSTVIRSPACSAGAETVINAWAEAGADFRLRFTSLPPLWAIRFALF